MAQNLEAFRGGFPAADRGPRTPVSAADDRSWPVGSVYQTVEAVNPRRLFRFGTWDRFADRDLDGVIVHYWRRTD